VLVASGANVLILDEPTNHLDLDAREALEDALQAFEGAVLLVSHDRALLDAVGSRTVAFEDGRLRSYEGGWAEYARVREEPREAETAAKQERRAGAKRAGRAAAERERRDGGGAAAGTAPGAAAERKRRGRGERAGERPSGNGAGAGATPSAPARRRRGPSKNALRRAAELEKEVERAEAALAALEDELADPAMWSSPSRTERSAARHLSAKRAVEEAYARWEAAAGSS
jgi:ATP-binding cassette, subfamily F, member 3